MSKNRREYAFTHHLRERFLQRTEKRYKHLRTCKSNDCDLCRNLVMEIKEKLEVRRPIDIEIARRINSAVECRAYLNDSSFMQWYYEKYGFDSRFEFLISDDIVFVVITDEGQKVVVTCLCAKNHISAAPTLRPKFNKIKKQREEKALKTLDAMTMSR